MNMQKLNLRAGRPSEAKKATNLADLADKAPTMRVNFDIARDKHTQLKVLAAQQRRSISDLLRDMIDERLSK